METLNYELEQMEDYELKTRLKEEIESISNWKECFDKMNNELDIFYSKEITEEEDKEKIKKLSKLTEDFKQSIIYPTINIEKDTIKDLAPEETKQYIINAEKKMNEAKDQNYSNFNKLLNKIDELSIYTQDLSHTIYYDKEATENKNLSKEELIEYHANTIESLLLAGQRGEWDLSNNSFLMPSDPYPFSEDQVYNSLSKREQPFYDLQEEVGKCYELAELMTKTHEDGRKR